MTRNNMKQGRKHKGNNKNQEKRSDNCARKIMDLRKKRGIG